MSKIDEMLKNEKVEWRKLGEVFKSRTGYTPSKSNSEFWKDGKIDWFTIDDIRQNGRVLCNSKLKISEKGVKGELFKANSIVLSTIASIGEYALIKTNFVINQQFMVFMLNYEFKKSINMDYIRYYFSKVSDFCKRNKRISNVPTVDGDRILNLLIPIPSIETQEKIVEILDKFTNYVTELQAELQFRTKQYEYYRDMLLSEDYLNKISEKMFALDNKLSWITLGEVAKINRGASPRPISTYLTENEDGVPWIKIGDAGKSSKYILNTEQRITIKGAEKSRVLKKGDFIMSNSMSYGRPYILGIDGAIHDGWAAISEYQDSLEPDFLYHYLVSQKVQKYWESKINSSSVSNLNSEIIRSLPLPLVDKKLQKKIAEILDKFQALLEDTKGLLPTEIEQRRKQYEYYREKLLTFDIDCGSQSVSQSVS